MSLTRTTSPSRGLEIDASSSELTGIIPEFVLLREGVHAALLRSAVEVFHTLTNQLDTVSIRENQL